MPAIIQIYQDMEHPQLTCHCPYLLFGLTQPMEGIYPDVSLPYTTHQGEGKHLPFSSFPAKI